MWSTKWNSAGMLLFRPHQRKLLFNTIRLNNSLSEFVGPTKRFWIIDIIGGKHLKMQKKTPNLVHICAMLRYGWSKQIKENAVLCCMNCFKECYYSSRMVIKSNERNKADILRVRCDKTPIKIGFRIIRCKRCTSLILLLRIWCYSIN